MTDAFHSIEAQRFGLKREGTRGTAEAEPAKWYPTRGRAELNYSRTPLEDTGLRGIQAKFPPISGPGVGEGTIPLYYDAQMMGEFLYSCLGGVTSAKQGDTLAYKHTLVPTGIEKQSYTFFLDRGLNILKYQLGVVKSVNIKSSADGLVEVQADVLFKGEAGGAIGTPAFPTQRYLSMQHTDVKVAGASNTYVKEWEITLDNQAEPLRTQSLSQDAGNIVAGQKFLVNGSFLIYFRNATERDKFIANTGVALRFLTEGVVAAEPHKYTVDINVYNAHYTAFPYGEDAGLLAAQATFEGHYSTSDSKLVQVDLMNLDTAYAA